MQHVLGALCLVATLTSVTQASSDWTNQTHGCTTFVRERSTQDVTLISATTCSGSRLRFIPDNVDDKIMVLSFDANLLRAVSETTLVRFRELKELDLSNNEIDSLSPLAFYANTRLTDLRLSNNRLASLPADLFSRLGDLQSLNLSRNFLRVIQNDTFSALRTLRVLDLSGNEIDSIKPAAWQHLRELRELYLVRNQLQTLPASMETFIPPNLIILRLGDNKWRCDCHLLWLKQYLLGNGAKSSPSHDKGEVVCLYGTEAVRTRALQYIAFTQMACAPELVEPRSGTLVRKVATLGSSVHFECALFAIPKREVYWLKDGEMLNTRTYFASSRFVVELTAGSNFTASLNISDVEYSDAGSYTCAFTNEAGSVTANFSLQVAPLDARELMAAGDLERTDDDGLIALVKSWFKDWTTFFFILVAIGGACVVVFVVSTVVYVSRTSRTSKRARRPKAGAKAAQCNSKYGQLDPQHDLHMDALSGQSASKFNEDAASDNLLVNAGDQTFSRTLLRTNANNLHIVTCNNNDSLSADANGESPTLPAPPPYNPATPDDFCLAHFDPSATPSLQRYGTQQRVQFQHQHQHDGHFCPVHGSKPAAMVPPITSGMMTMNAHHVHQPTCPMFSVVVGPQNGQNPSPFGTVRRQGGCPMHGCMLEGAHVHQDDLQSNFMSQPPFPLAPDALNGTLNLNLNTYMKVSQVDDCVRDNMDDANLRTFTANLLQNDIGSKKLGRNVGIEEEADSEALSTVV